MLVDEEQYKLHFVKSIHYMEISLPVHIKEFICIEFVFDKQVEQQARRYTIYQKFPYVC